MATITVGDAFDSYEDFFVTLSQHGKDNNVQWVIRDSKTVRNTNSLILDPRKHYEEKLAYKYAKFSCKHGPKRSTGSGLRPNQR